MDFGGRSRGGGRVFVVWTLVVGAGGGYPWCFQRSIGYWVELVQDPHNVVA